MFPKLWLIRVGSFILVMMGKGKAFHQERKGKMGEKCLQVLRVAMEKETRGGFNKGRLLLSRKGSPIMLRRRLLLDQILVWFNMTSLPKLRKGYENHCLFQDEGSSLAGIKVNPSGIIEEEKAGGAVGMEMEVPMGPTSNRSDLEVGEIDPAPTENFTTATAMEYTQAGLATLDSEVEMEPEDENEALDRVLKEMEDAIAAGEIIPIEELETSEDGAGIKELVVEDMESEVNNLNSGLPLDSDEGIGVKSNVAFDDLLQEMEAEEGADLGKGKYKESQVTKRKPDKGGVFSGVNSRKRNVQALLSPRKRLAPKGGPNAGSEPHPKDQGQDKGGSGGSKPPKP